MFGKLKLSKMKIIFYLSSIVFLITELKWLISPLECTLSAKRKDKLIKETKNTKYDNLTEEQKSDYKNMILSFIFIFGWMFIGLFTFQWQVFLAFLIFQFLIIAPLSKLTKYSYIYTLLHWLNSLLGLAFILFAIINSYHLKIDIDFIRYFR